MRLTTTSRHLSGRCQEINDYFIFLFYYDRHPEIERESQTFHQFPIEISIISSPQRSHRENYVNDGGEYSDAQGALDPPRADDANEISLMSARWSKRARDRQDSCEIGRIRRERPAEDRRALSIARERLRRTAGRQSRKIGNYPAHSHQTRKRLHDCRRIRFARLHGINAATQ